MSRCSIVIGVLVTSLIFGCTTEFGSFQSSQLTFLRDQILANTDRGPQPEWVIRWLGEERLVYAVNVGNEVLFANEFGDLLRFSGNQIVEARNLLPGEKTVHIERDPPVLRYRINGISIGLHACLNWELERTEKKSGTTSFIQNCSNGEITYANRFAVNQDQQLVRLIYYVHPQYPPVQLELASK